MSDILRKIADCIERGRASADSPHPADMRGRPGTGELVREALESGISPEELLTDALIPGMKAIGDKFSAGEAYLPDILMSKRAMDAAIEHLKPYFDSGELKRKGVFVIGTVVGDLHDIGKNIVAMVVQGEGYEIVDLGVNVAPEEFVKAVEDHPGSSVGLSALLTTTMSNMASIVKEIKARHPLTRVIIGGAPINERFAEKIGADAYSPDPQGAVNYLNSVLLLPDPRTPGAQK